MNTNQQRLIDQQTQRLATLTGERTIAVRSTVDGMVRYTIAGFPIDGERLSVMDPEVEQREVA